MLKYHSFTAKYGERSSAWLERWSVDPEVVGSSPIVRPIYKWSTYFGRPFVCRLYGARTGLQVCRPRHFVRFIEQSEPHRSPQMKTLRFMPECFLLSHRLVAFNRGSILGILKRNEV